MTTTNLTQTRAQFLDIIDGLAKTVEDVIYSLRTTTHEYHQPGSQNLDEYIPDDLVQGYPKEPVLQLVSDYLSQTAADVSLGFTDFKDHRTPADPVQRNTAWFPHTAQRWKQEHYLKKEAVDKSIAELEQDLREFAGRKLNAVASQFTPNGSPMLNLERRILGNGTLLPLLQKTRAELYRRAGVDENPLLLYRLCFQKVLEEKGWNALPDAELITKLQEEQVPKEVFEEFTGRKLVTAASAAAAEPRTSPATGNSYKDVTFEPQAYREEGQTDKKLFTYDTSLNRLRQAGFERHPRPVEVFSLLVDNLENKLTPQQKAIADDMLKSYGEWLSLAMERQGDLLVCYFDPEGLIWRNNRYEKDNFRFTERKEYDVKGKPSEQWINLNQFSDELVMGLYGRQFKDLPPNMREGNKRAQLYLPPESVLWPAGRSYFDGNYVVNGCYYYYGRASRGGSPVGAR